MSFRFRAAFAFIGIAALSCALGAGSSSAADGEGRYAVRGVGSQTCGAFFERAQGSEVDRVVYKAWIAGYLTGVNRVAEDTFDSSYIADNAKVATLVSRICRAEPEILLETAVARLLTFMNEGRVAQESELVRIKAGGRSVTLRQATLEQVKTVLTEKGYLSSSVDGFDETVRDALVAFQKKRKLPATGLPDAVTLVSALNPDL